MALAAGERIIVHVADPTTFIHHLDPHDVAAVELDPLSAQHAAPAAGLRTTYGIGRLVARTAAIAIKAVPARHLEAVVLLLRPGLRPRGTGEAASDRSS